MQICELSTDVVVVGSGAAGSAAAREAADSGASVLLLSKDPLSASDSKIAEGFVTVQGSAEADDTPDRLATNMAIEGGDIGDKALNRQFAEDSADAYGWLVRQGLLSGHKNGAPNTLPLPMGGHDRKRTIGHENGALDYAHATWAAVHKGGITALEDVWAIDLTKDVDRVTGLVAYHASEGRFLVIAAGAVVLACGGASSLYFPWTDTMRNNTGDGYGMALRAGAALVDMEQVQFLPFGLTSPHRFRGLLAGEPVSCGPMGLLRDKNGQIILSELMVRTRAECAAAIARAVDDGRGTENGGCWLDLTGNVEGAAGPLFVDLMEDKAHALLKTVRKAHGTDAARFKSQWEVRPTAHYFMGGVQADPDGRSDLPGLFVAGQVMGGLHGANRLGSTSLAEGAVFGLRAGRAAAKFSQDYPAGDIGKVAAPVLEWAQGRLAQSPSSDVLKIRLALQSKAYDAIGPLRNHEDLVSFADDLGCLAEQIEAAAAQGPAIWNQSFLDLLDTRNMIESARAVVVSAIARPQSLGSHTRADNTTRPKSLDSVRLRKTQTGHQTSIVPRTRCSLSTRLRFAAGKTLRILRLRLLHILPQRLRERALVRFYTKLIDPKESVA